MSYRKLILTAAAGLVPIALLASGCTMCKAKSVEVAAAPSHEQQPVMKVADLLPPDAKPGECYVRVFIPERFESVKETVCVREASQRLEIVPARYEWVEETVLVKDASTILEEVPAEFEVQEQNVLVDPGHTGWHVEKTAKCVSQLEQATPAPEMFCLVSHEPVYQTVTTNVLVKPATTRVVTVPAEYQTVRRQKLVAPATTRTIPIPAEFATIDKVHKVADSRVEWQRVACKPETQARQFETNKDTIAILDYTPLSR